MLDPKALNAGISIIQELAVKGVNLAVVPDTPLALIVRCTPIIGIDAPALSFADANEKLLEISRDPDHGAEMASAVQMAAQGVRRSLDYTRNTVMPHIRDVFKSYDDLVKSYGEATQPVNIVVKYLPAIYKNPIGRAFLDRWENAPSMSVPALANLGNYSEQEILDLAKISDDGDFNANLEKLLSANDGKGFAQIRAVLNGSASPVTGMDPEYALPLAIVMTNAETPREGVQMTMIQYNAQRAVLANVAAKIGLRQLDYLDQAIKNNILYYGLAIEKNVVTVVGEVYRDMLDKGLTAEIVIGNELLGRKYRGLALMSSPGSDNCTAAYIRDREIRQQAHELGRKQHQRKALLDCLRKDQQRIATEGAFTVDGDTAEKSWQRLRDFTDRTLGTVFADGDPRIVMAAIINAVWYAHTDAWRLIDIMLDIEKSSPNLETKEVATLASLRYIADWVSSQIVVTATRTA